MDQLTADSPSQEIFSSKLNLSKKTAFQLALVPLTASHDPLQEDFTIGAEDEVTRAREVDKILEQASSATRGPSSWDTWAGPTTTAP